jgi:methyl-accepting chemotaxis protein
VLLDTAQSLRDEAISELVYYLVLSLAAAVLAILLAVFIVRSIARPLNVALENIQTRGGDLTQRLAVPGSDEVPKKPSRFVSLSKTMLKTSKRAGIWSCQPAKR